VAVRALLLLALAAVLAGCGGGDERPGLRLAGDATGALAVSSGSVWAGSERPRTLERLADDGRVLVAVRVPGAPTEIVVAGDRVHALDSAGLTTLDAVSGDLLARAALPPGLRGRHLAAGAGAVWVGAIDAAGSGVLVRIDSEGRRVTGRLRLAGGAADVEVAGGRVWVTDRAVDGVRPVDPQTLRPGEGVDLDEEREITLAPPVGGRLWAEAGGEVRRVVPPGAPTWTPVVPSPRRDAVRGLAAGGDRLWALVGTGDGYRLVGLDAVSGAPGPAADVDPGVAARGLAVGERVAWIAAGERVVRVSRPE
jgi:hypothetical protein